MVTKFLTAHGVESAAKDLVGDYMMSANSQLALSAANGRYPANTDAAKRVKDPVLAQFGKAGTGGVPMPNIPQMGSVWSDLGAAWVKSTKGSGRRQGPRPPSRSRLATSRTRSASRISTAGWGVRRGAPPSPRHRRSVVHDPAERVSTTAAPVPEVPRPSAGVAAWSMPSRAVAALSGPIGSALKLFLLALVNALAVWASVILATDEKWIALGVLVIATAAIDFVYLSRSALPRSSFGSPASSSCSRSS